MKKIFALLLSLAMVASLFAGVAFATAANTVVTATEAIVWGGPVGSVNLKATITGTVVNEATGVMVDDNIVWELKVPGGATVQSGLIPKANKGQFSIDITMNAITETPAATDVIPNRVFELVMTPVNASAFNASSTEVVVRYAMDVEKPALSLSATATRTVTGYLKDARGLGADANGVVLVKLAGNTKLPAGLVHAQTNFTGTKTNAAPDAAKALGFFSFDLSADDQTGYAGPWYLVMASGSNYIIYDSIVNNPLSLTVTATPSSLLKNIAQPVTFKAMRSTTDRTVQTRFAIAGLTKSNLVEDTTLAYGGAVTQNGKKFAPVTGAVATNVTIWAELKKSFTTGTPTDDDVVALHFLPSNVSHSVTIKADKALTVVATWDITAGENNFYTDYPENSGTATIGNEIAGILNVLGLPSKLNVGTTAANMTVYYENNNNFDKVTVKVTGAGMNYTGVKTGAASKTWNDFNFAPTTGGTVTVEIVAEKASSVYNFSREIPVTGYIVEMNPTSVLVDSTNDITVKITDTKGVPVNNATVWIGTTQLIRVTDDRQAGVYTRKDFKMTTVGQYDIIVREAHATPESGAEMVRIANGFRVTGIEKYAITADETALLMGKTQTVVFTVTDAGVPVLGLTDWTLTSIKADGTETSEPLSVTALGLGKYRASMLVDQATVETTGLKVTARINNSAKNIGVTNIAVVKPVAQVSVEKITELIRETITVKVIDPRDGSTIIAPLTVNANDLDVEYKNSHGENVTNNFAERAEFVFQALVKRSTATTAKKFYLDFTVALNTNVKMDAQVAAAPMNIKVTPEALVLGQHTLLTIIVTDVHGNPVVGHNVTVGGAAAGKTNDNGIVTYSLQKNETSDVTVAVFGSLNNAANAAYGTRSKAVPVGVDSESPVIGAVETEVDTDTVTITVTDNVRVARLVVNGKEIVIVPRASVTAMVELKPGLNRLHVIALDAAGNGSEEIFEVTYNAPVAPKDETAPVIEVNAPAIVSDNFATISIKVTDAGGLAQIVFNNNPKFFVPGNTAVITERVNLVEGENLFVVHAADVAGNWATKEITVTYKKPAPPAPPVVEKHVITIGKANPALGLDVPANVRNGRLMVPFRWFGEKILGATVDYKVVGSAEIVTLVKGSTTVELTLNSTIAKVNNVPVSLDVAAYATGGRTLVPARFVAETFGYTVDWNAATDEVTFTKK